jgi:uracil-DNA glycosylase
MTAEEYFGDWLKVINTVELAKVVQEINKLPKDRICPEYSNIFRAFHLCPLKELKVILIGQDPYPQKGVATGILFGNKEEQEILSPSLQVIREACINFEIPHNSIIFDQTLESWAKQGVLMINSALTCTVGKVGSHTMLWRPFMSKLLSNLSKYDTGLIYVLFGEQAKTFKPYINNKMNTILEEKHPAYYARVQSRMPSTVFKEISRLTKEKYGEPIIWFKE